MDSERFGHDQLAVFELHSSRHGCAPQPRFIEGN